VGMRDCMYVEAYIFLRVYAFIYVLCCVRLKLEGNGPYLQTCYAKNISYAPPQGLISDLRYIIS
jgi:hypothetical protein